MASDEPSENGETFIQFDMFRDMPVIHGFSTRLGGVSEGEWSSMNISFTRGDEEEKVKETMRLTGHFHP